MCATVQGRVRIFQPTLSHCLGVSWAKFVTSQSKIRRRVRTGEAFYASCVPLPAEIQTEGCFRSQCRLLFRGPECPGSGRPSAPSWFSQTKKNQKEPSPGCMGDGTQVSCWSPHKNVAPSAPDAVLRCRAAARIGCSSSSRDHASGVALTHAFASGCRDKGVHWLTSLGARTRGGQFPGHPRMPPASASWLTSHAASSHNGISRSRAKCTTAAFGWGCTHTSMIHRQWWHVKPTVGISSSGPRGVRRLGDVCADGQWWARGAWRHMVTSSIWGRCAALCGSLRAQDQTGLPADGWWSGGRLWLLHGCHGEPAVSVSVACQWVWQCWSSGTRWRSLSSSGGSSLNSGRGCHEVSAFHAGCHNVADLDGQASAPQTAGPLWNGPWSIMEVSNTMQKSKKSVHFDWIQQHHLHWAESNAKRLAVLRYSHCLTPEQSRSVDNIAPHDPPWGHTGILRSTWLTQKIPALTDQTS